MCSSNREKVNAMNELAGKTDYLGIDLVALKSVTGPTRFFDLPTPLARSLRRITRSLPLHT